MAKAAKNFSKPIQQKGDKKTGKKFNKKPNPGGATQKPPQPAGKPNKNQGKGKNINNKPLNNGKNTIAEQKAAQAKIQNELDMESDDDFLGAEDSGSEGSGLENTLDSTIFGAGQLNSDDEEDESNEESDSDEDVPALVTRLKEKAISEAQNETDSDSGDDADAEKQPNKKGMKKMLTPEAFEARKNAISVFVGNLSIKTNRKKIIKHFGKFGKIIYIRLRTSNGGPLSKGNLKFHKNQNAFIGFETMDSAKASLAMNGEKIADHILRVNMKPSNDAVPYDPKRTIFVGNLKNNVTDEILHDVFSTCGDMDYVRPLMGPYGCKGGAFVCFKDAASVALALKLNKTLIEGREARIERYSLRKPGQKNDAQKNGSPKRPIAGKAKKHNPNSPQRPTADKAKSNKKAPFVGLKKDTKKNQKKNKKPKGNQLLAKKIAPKAAA